MSDGKEAEAIDGYYSVKNKAKSYFLLAERK